MTIGKSYEDIYSVKGNRCTNNRCSIVLQHHDWGICLRRADRHYRLLWSYLSNSGGKPLTNGS